MGGRGVVTCVLALVACRELPALPPGVCGNGVVEAGEDCDGAPDPRRGSNLACAAPADADACRYTCASAACPEGWSCGGDGVCRYATGQLIADPPVAFSHDELAIADVDGDGLSDLVAFDARGVHVMFERRNVIVASPDHLVGPGVVADLDGDHRADIVAPIGEGIAIARGEIDRTVTPSSYASFQTHAGDWFVPVRVPVPGEADAVVSLQPHSPVAPSTDIGTDAVLFLVPSGVQQHTTPVTADTPPPSLGPIALRGDLDAPSAEDELAISPIGEPRMWLLRPTLTLAGYVALVPLPIALPGSAVSDGRLLLTDFDSDGDLDVLAGMREGTPGVALVSNPSGATTQQATDVSGYFSALAAPGLALPDVPSAPQLFPLAVSDFDADGTLDAVSPDGVFVRRGATLAPVYRRSTAAPWREAVIADVDRDGRLDVIVGSNTSGIDVLRNRPGFDGSAGFTRVAIDTLGPPALLRAGDFDGDGLGDVAFREHTDRDRVRILFGAIGALSPPIAVTALASVERLEVGRFRDTRGMDDIVDDLVLVGSDGSRDGAAFVTGSGDRRVRSVLFLSRGSKVDVPLGAVVGHFVDVRGNPDLAVVAEDPQGQRRIWVFTGAPNAGYRSDQAEVVAPLAALGSLVIRRLVAADLDQDGRDEIIALGVDPAGTTRLVVVGLHAGNAPSIDTIALDVGAPLDLIAGDLDRDGRQELFVVGSGGVARWQSSDLTWIADGARSACIAQLDDDPQLELALLANGTLSIHDGLSLALESTIAAPSGNTVRAGDLDGDGLPDLIVGDGSTVTPLHSVPQVEAR